MDGTGLIWTSAQTKEAVWVGDEEVAWKDGTIESLVDGSELVISCVDGSTVTVPLNKVGLCTKVKVLPRDVGPRSKGVDNMDNLTHLHEGSILQNVCVRFGDQKIYTRTGPILVALNPFEWHPIYAPAQMKRYVQCSDVELDESEPHCFAEAERAHRGLARHERNQSLIICGESGSGKTETTKLMLQYLVDTYTSTNKHGIAERIMKSNPVMEAFGNAKTLRNNNSSRFGKFIRLYFEKKAHTVTGAHISQYLLEKSRTVRQGKGERNYHVFYQLCKGADAKQQAELGLSSSSLHDFRYLNQSGCVDVFGVDDSASFADTLDAMAAIGIQQAQVEAILRVLAAVLHLGNATFDKGASSSSTGYSDESKDPTFSFSASLDIACQLLQCEANELEHALTTRFITAGGKCIPSPLEPNDSSNLRDALSKAIYQRLFTHIVKRVNESLGCNDEVTTRKQLNIGILDIYGFESFEENGFEQLLINFANEKLQSLFNEQVFQSDEKTYQAEQVPFSRTDFPNNDKCLCLMNNIFKLMHDECLRMNAGSDKSLASQITQHCKGEMNFEQCGPGSKKKNTTALHFSIKHYAGSIIYTCEAFVDKNRDTLYSHVGGVIAKSLCMLTSELFEDFMLPEDCIAASGSSQLQNTVARSFSAQVFELTEDIHATSPIFVRCIKSNNQLVPNVVDRNSVLRQLNNAGVVAALEMRRIGFPNRILYRDFVMRCRALLPQGTKLLQQSTFNADDKEAEEKEHNNLQPEAVAALTDENKRLAVHMFAHPLMPDECKPGVGVAMGKTKLFLRANILHTIDGVVQGLITEQVVLVQTTVRRFLCERRFQHSVQYAISLQAQFRGQRDRRVCAKQIALLKAKKEWIARAADFNSLETQLRDTTAVAEQLTLLVEITMSNSLATSAESRSKHVSALGLDVLVAQLDAAQDESGSAREHLALRADLNAMDASMARAATCVNQATLLADTALDAQKHLEKKAAALRADLVMLKGELKASDALDQEHTAFFTNKRTIENDLANKLFSPRENDSASAEIENYTLVGASKATDIEQADKYLVAVVDRFARGYARVKQEAWSSIETAADVLSVFDIDAAEIIVETTRSLIGEAKHLFEAALVNKREMDQHIVRLRRETERSKELFVGIMRRWFKATHMRDIRQIKQCVAEVQNTLLVLLTMIGGGCDDVGALSLKTLLDGARDDLSETEFDFGVDENDEKKSVHGFMDVDVVDAAVTSARAAMQHADELMGRAGAMLCERENAITACRIARRRADASLQATIQEHSSLAEATLLFESVSVKKALNEAQVWVRRCETAAQKSLDSVEPVEDIISLEIRKCAAEAEAHTERFVAEAHRVRANIDSATAAQAMGRAQMLPALDTLREVRALVARYGLDKNRDVLKALLCSEKEINEVDRLLTLDKDPGKGGKIPSSASICSIPTAVAAAAAVISAAAELVEEEIAAKQRTQTLIETARAHIMAVTLSLGQLEAQLQQNPVFESRSLSALCKASSCGAEVWNKANELTGAVHRVKLVLSRASSKLAKLQALELETLSFENQASERKLVNDLTLCATHAKAGASTMHTMFNDLVELRTAEINRLGVYKRQLVDMQLRFKRVQQLNAAIATGELRTNGHGGVLHVQRAVDNTDELIVRYAQVVHMLTSNMGDKEDKDEKSEGSDIEWVNPTINHPELLYTDSIKVLMFASHDPVQVLTDAQLKALQGLEEIEQLVETGREILSERTRLSHEAELRQQHQAGLDAIAKESTLAALRHVREDAVERLRPTRRLVAMVAEVCSFCENKLEAPAMIEQCNATVSQLVHVNSCLAFVEKAIIDGDAILAAQQIDVAVAQGLKLETLLFSANPSQPPRSDAVASRSNNSSKRIGYSNNALYLSLVALAPEDALRAKTALSTNGNTITNVKQALDMDESRLCAIAARVDLHSFRSSTNAKDVAEWGVSPLLDEARAGLKCARKHLQDLSNYSPTTFVTLQCVGVSSGNTGDVLGPAAKALQADVEQLKEVTKFVSSAVTKAQVAFERGARQKARHQQSAAKVKRLVLKYVCPKE